MKATEYTVVGGRLQLQATDAPDALPPTRPAQRFERVPVLVLVLVLDLNASKSTTDTASSSLARLALSTVALGRIPRRAPWPWLHGARACRTHRRGGGPPN